MFDITGEFDPHFLALGKLPVDKIQSLAVPAAMPTKIRSGCERDACNDDGAMTVLCVMLLVID